ncbi:succinate dehydrogenase / fumarate reductase membrane anchor subunit [Marinobacter pelagius]|uniref:Succinate dehydrogenase hydrophobic membrane anchor subunit n=2 Tax=Marinobacter pelagius TaxID=379482 RepID=A0A1I4VWH4_9GAMM|nr:succinate dehydrogenase, hydrophobic membrane anchor protein [Marinobacter pelagius]RBP28564.1 succinate dehydrogenase / fumarate reductase membrane anchor subunit [Marinobacter pelagius]SFN05583.1 succinate dehydrogenase / fumarate reductase membrane anchor subunit [Marinobacter pelagius]
MGMNSATNIGRNGIQDWIIQRVTAYVLALYTLFLLGFFVTTDVDYQSWSALFGQGWFKIFTLLALLSIAGHAWVGLWTVSTDYIKSAMQRFLFQTVCVLVIFVYVVWGIQILWGL